MPWIHFLKKKEVAQKEEKKGHLTSEEDGKPNFKGRMMLMADPLIIGVHLRPPRIRGMRYIDFTRFL